MSSDKLRMYQKPNLRKPRLLLGFSGWMDGGDVSSGTMNVLIERLEAQRFGEIEPHGFYIYNVPGGMDVSALFRPHCRIRKGLIRAFDFPENPFYVVENADLILFLGKEPNLGWSDYADCIFTLCREVGVEMVYFIGSVSGLVPHTRDPQLFCSVSKVGLKPRFDDYGVKFSEYEGPASIVTYLTTRAKDCGIDMVSLVATVPAYVQGNNPKCIEAVTRRIAGMLGVHVEIDDLRTMADEFERKLSEIVQEEPELAQNVVKLEENYDNEVFNTEMGDLKQWLHQKGIRLD
ncbi:MAG: PAC2 family protein [Sedimentisphaerales bacterium]|nr:PAC2 family protein [Sedimentisphaerales bacterium]